MPKNIESLINTGIHFSIADKAGTQDPRKNIVVCGVARSGTSLVAGALFKLGVFMGNTANPPVYEDVTFSRAMEEDDVDAARRIIADYDDKYPIWGWKRPSSVNFLDVVDGIFPNPVYVFIFKDIFSIAKRNRISMHSDLISNMRNAYRQLGKILNFIEKRNPTAMMVSYEKALMNRQHFVQSMCDFIGIQVSEDQFKAAVNFIRPNPADYLDLSRITKARGVLGKITETSVAGWARAVYNEVPIKVELYVNDRQVAVTSADIFRKDILEKGIHPTGHVGFLFTREDDHKLKKGDVVRVRAENEINDLNNCPQVFEG